MILILLISGAAASRLAKHGLHQGQATSLAGTAFEGLDWIFSVKQIIEPQARYEQHLGQGLPLCARTERWQGHICLPGARQHIKGLQKLICLDSLRSIFVCQFDFLS